MINKIIITAEAKFDYEEIVAYDAMPKEEIRRQAEENFEFFAPCGTYSVRRLYDERADIMLMLFFRKAYTYGNITAWMLNGICDERDFSEDLDEKGLIKNWLDNYLII